MYNAIERLESLTVADVMTKGVVQIRAWQPMCEVAALFRDRDVSAAPVVDEQGRCVGILSATDFLTRDSACGCRHSPGAQQAACRVRSGSEDTPLAVTHPSDDVAGDCMTDAVQTVSEEASLATAAKIMCAQHVHRLVVIDEGHRVKGLISTMDLVSTLASVLDEMHVAQ